MILKKIYYYLCGPNCLCDKAQEIGKTFVLNRILLDLSRKPFGTKRTVGFRPTHPRFN